MYNTLLTEVSAYLKRYLRLKLRSESDQADVLQDVLISLHNARHTYDSSYPFKPWLFKVVQSRLIDHFRKNKKHIETATYSSENTLELITAEAEVSQIEVSDFNKALANLTNDQRAVLLAIKIEGKSIKDIALERATSESAVKITAHRAYQSLFEFLGAPS